MNIQMGDTPEKTTTEVETQDVEEEVTEAPEEANDSVEAVKLEDVDPEEELWPEGPKVGQILEWQKEHGQIYVSTFAGEKHVVWRATTRPEYKKMVKLMEQSSASGQMTEADAKLFQEEYMTELCMLFPTFSRANQAKELAGIPSIISQQVLEASGFVALEVRAL